MQVSFYTCKFLKFIKLIYQLIFSLQSVEEVTVRFFNEMRRKYYTTPSNYLELLKLFQNIFKKKKQKILTLKNKISNGLNVSLLT